MLSVPRSETVRYVIGYYVVVQVVVFTHDEHHAQQQQSISITSKSTKDVRCRKKPRRATSELLCPTLSNEDRSSNGNGDGNIYTVIRTL